MFTKNFYETFFPYSMCYRSNVTGRPIVGVGGTDLSTIYSVTTRVSFQKPIANYTSEFISPNQILYDNKANSSYSPTGIIFGTGSTAPTVDDYCLSGSPISGLDSDNITYVTNITYSDTGITYTVVYTISNTTGADITIGEIGIFSYCTYRISADNASAYYAPILLERTALEDLITIPADGVGQVTYNITMPFPY